MDGRTDGRTDGRMDGWMDSVPFILMIRILKSHPSVKLEQIS